MTYNPVKTHPIHDALKRLLALQKNAVLTSVNEEISEQHSWYLDRIFYLAKKADGQLRKRFSLSINLNALNNLNTSAESMITELNNYISNRNTGHLDGAFNQAEQGFQIYLQQAFPIQSNSDVSDADAALSSLKSASQGAILEVQNEKIKLLAEIRKLTSSVSANIDSVSALSDTIESHKSESGQEVAGIKKSYSELAEKFERQFSDMSTGWEEATDDKITQIDEDIKDLIDRISVKETEARSLVQSVGEVLVTGTYQKTAKDESVLANNFRWITVGLFVTGILIVLSNYIVHVIAYFNGETYTENSWTIISRFLTAIVVSLPAFYTARESARHRTNADKARQRELELSTLGPFIELLPVDIKTESLTHNYLH